MEVGVKLGGGGGGRVGTIGVIEEDMGDGMQCSEHPYRNNPGGICAFCLQEKLGKLVSSSSPLPIHPFPTSSSPGSSSPSFRSEANVGVSVHATNNGNNNNGSFGSTSSSSATKPKLGHEYDQFYIKKARIPFLPTKKKKKTSVHGGSDRANNTVVTFKRSKSTVTPGRGRFLEDEESFSPRKRNGFWSFLSLSSSSRLNGHGGSNSVKKVDKEKDCTTVQEQKMVAPSNNGPVCMKKVEISEEDSSVVAHDPNCHVGAAVPSFERKVSRSRSVGCGSRSFSGDFFERISTGFGDCTLRRVESQREGKQKVTPSSTAVYGGAGYDPHHHHHHNIHHQHGQQFIKERVKCGGIFSGFMMTSSLTSSICSSASTYNWVNPSSNNEDVVAAKSSSSGFGGGGGSGSSSNNTNNNGRNPTKSSWSWAFASPMRAFSKPSSSSSSKGNGKKDVNKNTTNLDAIPSLLTVSS